LTFDQLNFKLVRARGKTRLSCELGANPFSGSQDISYINKKVTDGAKNRTLRSSLRAVTNHSICHYNYTLEIAIFVDKNLNLRNSEKIFKRFR